MSKPLQPEPTINYSKHSVNSLGQFSGYHFLTVFFFLALSFPAFLPQAHGFYCLLKLKSKRTYFLWSTESSSLLYTLGQLSRGAVSSFLYYTLWDCQRWAISLLYCQPIRKCPCRCWGQSSVDTVFAWHTRSPTNTLKAQHDRVYL